MSLASELAFKYRPVRRFRMSRARRDQCHPVEELFHLLTAVVLAVATSNARAVRNDPAHPCPAICCCAASQLLLSM